MDAKEILIEAENLFRKRNLEEALQYYKEAGIMFRRDTNYRDSAHCFQRAALCEKLRTGLESVMDAANYSEWAAKDALKVKDFAFARWQFREAALLFEREGDFERYSRCYIESQHAFVEYLWHVFFTGKKHVLHQKEEEPANWLERISALFLAFFGLISRFLWGYGEHPFKVVLCALGWVAFCAVLYQFGDISVNGQARMISFPEALYMSGVTFTTIGYGDFVPLSSWLRILAVFEGMSGFILVSMAVVALTRRYLRVYR